ncbi:hypothetical protein [Niallia sp. MER 6]|uniref:hypothetical protein n=1 Tax=Niallia sp. MER 6 TaxID=2939567 RepID=UPI00203EE076|nr:hypothetical protein [Niallia sp. MER 6]MCM3032595.1 hypothetical protein [Niallia sp. MER 6]
MSERNRSSKVQCRLNTTEKARFEEIRQIIVFESQTGNRLTPYHAFAKEDKVTDADVIRYLINNFRYED